MCKISTVHIYHIFFVQSLPSLHEYDVKLLCWSYHINVLDG